MSRIDNNPLLTGACGMLGKAIVFRQLHGKTILSKRPKRPATITAHQEIMRSRFQRAVEYAKKQMQNEQRKAEYAGAIDDRRHSAYAVALTDCMTAPKVNAIDHSNYRGTPGDTFIIHATDDFKVTEVSVTIFNGNGIMIEQGNAILAPGLKEQWRYVITKTNSTLAGTRILAQAMDQPGNVGLLEVVISR
jgi:hypothetical protein